MMVYGIVWRAVCGLLGALGIVLGFIVVPLNVMIPLVIVGAVIGVTVALGSRSETTDTGSTPGPGQPVLIATMAGSALAAITGLSAIVGGGFVGGLVLLLGVSSPPAVRWYSRGLRRTPAAKAEPPPLSTAQLCRQWQDSYEALREAATAAARLRIVEARQRCLDELERRDPDGLNAWLASTASAASDPSRFLTERGQANS